jgi:hypothetical protein
MGSKPSHAIPSNRPESGGADHDDQREKSGLLDRDKQRVAQSEAAARETEDTEQATDRIPGEDE